VTRIGRIRLVDPTGAEFDDSASGDAFRKLSKEPRLKVLQTSAPVRDAVWRLVNEHCCTPPGRWCPC
jgi:hypothetical protein